MIVAICKGLAYIATITFFLFACAMDSEGIWQWVAGGICLLSAGYLYLYIRLFTSVDDWKET